MNYTVASPFKILVLNFKNYDNAHHANPSIKEYDHTGNSKTVWEAGDFDVRKKLRKIGSATVTKLLEPQVIYSKWKTQIDRLLSEGYVPIPYPFHDGGLYSKALQEKDQCFTQFFRLGTGNVSV